MRSNAENENVTASNDVFLISNCSSCVELQLDTFVACTIFNVFELLHYTFKPLNPTVYWHRLNYSLVYYWISIGLFVAAKRFDFVLNRIQKIVSRCLFSFKCCKNGEKLTTGENLTATLLNLPLKFWYNGRLHYLIGFFPSLDIDI